MSKTKKDAKSQPFTEESNKRPSFTGKGSLTGDGKGSLSKKNVSFTQGGSMSSLGSDSRSSMTGMSKNKKKKKKSDGDESDDDSTQMTQSSNQDDEDKDSDYDSDDESMADIGKNIFSHTVKATSKAATAFIKTFVHYGPPYNNRPFSHDLVNECCKPVCNLRAVHKILNKRTDPNMPDEHDLYYTPTHWCCRNLHLIAMKMLRRAGAKINVTDEMGVTPLDLAVMMKRPPDMRKKQIKMVLIHVHMHIHIHIHKWSLLM